MENMFDLLRTEPKVRDCPGAIPLVTQQGQVAFDNVVFGYNPANPVLKGVSFTVPGGCGEGRRGGGHCCMGGLCLGMACYVRSVAAATWLMCCAALVLPAPCCVWPCCVWLCCVAMLRVAMLCGATLRLAWMCGTGSDWFM